MTLLTPTHPLSTELRTFDQLLEQLGNVPLSRIRLRPPPGTAQEQDVVAVEREENRLCELVDGVLVEKTVGYRESILAMAIVAALRSFVRPRKLGLVTGPDGMVSFFPGLVRLPDVAFVSWTRIADGAVPKAAIAKVVPDLAVEVLSEGNTRAEMHRKLCEYFEAGVQHVWCIDGAKRTAIDFSSVTEFVTLASTDVLHGSGVLEGFDLSLADLFAELDEESPH